MKRHTALIVFVLTIGFLLSVPESRGQGCTFPRRDLTQGEHREYRGLYENKAYGYSLTIPADLVGYDDVNPFYQHGFGIALGKEPQSYVFVNGEPNSLEFARPAEAASNALKYLRKHGNKIKSSKITDSQLGQLKAAFLVATYTCPGSADVFKSASMMAISPDKSKLYNVTLYAHFERFQRDHSVFDALVTSWKHLDDGSGAGYQHDNVENTSDDENDISNSSSFFAHEPLRLQSSE